MRTTKWLFSHCSASSHRTRSPILFQSCLFTSNRKNQVQKMNGENGRKGVWTIWGKMLLNISKRNWMHFYIKMECTVMAMIICFFYKCNPWTLGYLHSLFDSEVRERYGSSYILGKDYQIQTLVFFNCASSLLCVSHFHCSPIVPSEV